MIQYIISFLVMLNPFAMFLYLHPVMKNLKHRDFLIVLLKATVISFAIFALFLLSGNLLFEKVLQIHFDAFRIFGGIIIFSFSYFFIVKGQKAFIHMKEDLDDLASEIALPFMVGAGTISVSVLMGYEMDNTIGIIALLIVMAINYLMIIFLKFIREKLANRHLRVAFDKNMEVLLRLTGFFIGAIGINMIMTGIRNFFF
ncbi:MarC family protein [Candidatus Woesearchaeota archaeon]|nr:MarC family protein [Candidatus Woesearchaeota archaeon]